MRKQEEKIELKNEIVPIVELDKIIQVDGGFFCIEKKKIANCFNKEDYFRYFLRRIITPKTMEIINKVVYSKDKLSGELKEKKA